MQENPQRNFANPKAARRQEFVYKGVSFVLEATPYGEDYFGIMYPDPQDAYRACTQYAQVNGRLLGDQPKAYPVTIYSDVQAIKRSLQTPDGCEPLDESVIWAFYDNEPALFAELRGAALIVLGFMDDVALNSGKVAWQQAFTALREIVKNLQRGEPAKAMAQAKLGRAVASRALKDFDPAYGELSPDDPADTDPAMEGIAAGNAPEAR